MNTDLANERAFLPIVAMNTLWTNYSKAFFELCDAHCDPLLRTISFAPQLDHEESACVYREYSHGQLRFCLRYFSNQFDGSGLESLASLRPGTEFSVARMHEAHVASLMPLLAADAATAIVPGSKLSGENLTAMCVEWTQLFRSVGREAIIAALLQTGNA